MANGRLVRYASSPERYTDDPEEEPLLGDADRADTDGDAERDGLVNHESSPNPHSGLPVYETIWKIRRDIMDMINDPYSLDQLRSPRLTTSVVQPLMQRYYALEDVSVVFCILVNRVQFLKDQTYQSHYHSVSLTRALLCEILAMKILRQFDEDSSGADGLLLLSHIVIAGFDPFQNAPVDLASSSSKTVIWATQGREDSDRQMTALEVAILSESKLFLSSSACQKVVDAIYTGRIVYTPISFMEILPDHYKHKPISIYDPRKAPLLNTYRLSVPRIRTAIEVGHFVVLLVLFILLMLVKTPHAVRVEEVIFDIFVIGWIIDQLSSMLEHGWHVYSQNLWSFLDVTFSVVFIFYFILRLVELSSDTVTSRTTALDILALSGPLLLPRLAFNFFSENLMLVALRDMMSKFLFLTFLAIWSFAGFFLALLWLGWSTADRVSPAQTAEYMIFVWFGLDGSGIEESPKLHPVIGPLLMVAFAILGNTLFLTILVSTLSSSYAKIASHATAEIQFRRAVLTFEGVKSDAIFAYPPPFNILALVVLLPLKFLLSPRWFHKVNITGVRLIQAPLLLLIAAYERRYLWPSEKEVQQARARRLNFTSFNWLHVHGDIQAVFEAPPPELVNRQADVLEARRRKSWWVCAPGTKQNSTIGQKSPTAARRKPSLGSRSTHLGRIKTHGSVHSAHSTHSSHSALSGAPAEQQPAAAGDGATDTTARLERIEEMLEHIGQTLEDDGEDQET